MLDLLEFNSRFQTIKFTSYFADCGQHTTSKLSDILRENIHHMCSTGLLWSPTALPLIRRSTYNARYVLRSGLRHPNSYQLWIWYENIKFSIIVNFSRMFFSIFFFCWSCSKLVNRSWKLFVKWVFLPPKWLNWDGWAWPNPD